MEWKQVLYFSISLGDFLPPLPPPSPLLPLSSLQLFSLEIVAPFLG
jgi:hypothetical protein